MLLVLLSVFVELHAARPRRAKGRRTCRRIMASRERERLRTEARVI
jgi:hypothetical protein